MLRFIDEAKNWKSWYEKVEATGLGLQEGINHLGLPDWMHTLIVRNIYQDKYAGKADIQGYQADLIYYSKELLGLTDEQITSYERLQLKDKYANGGYPTSEELTIIDLPTLSESLVYAGISLAVQEEREEARRIFEAEIEEKNRQVRFDYMYEDKHLYTDNEGAVLRDAKHVMEFKGYTEDEALDYLGTSKERLIGFFKDNYRNTWKNQKSYPYDRIMKEITLVMKRLDYVREQACVFVGLSFLPALEKFRNEIQAILPDHNVQIHIDKNRLYIPDPDDKAREILKFHGYKYDTRHGVLKAPYSTTYYRVLPMPNSEEALAILKALDLPENRMTSDDRANILIHLTSYDVEKANDIELHKIVVGWHPRRGHWVKEGTPEQFWRRGTIVNRYKLVSDQELLDAQLLAGEITPQEWKHLKEVA